MQIYAVIGVLLIIAAGVTYIDRSATARYEAAAIAKGMKVQRESTEDVTRRSAAATAKLEKDLESSRARAVSHRTRAAELAGRVLAVQAERDAAIKAGEKPEETGFCRPGCAPAWE